MESMIEDIREYKYGTVTTTGRLARAYGYEDMETSDLFDLYEALLRPAKTNHNSCVFQWKTGLI